MLTTLLLQLLALTGFVVSAGLAGLMLAGMIIEARRGGSRPGRDNRMEVRSWTQS